MAIDKALINNDGFGSTAAPHLSLNSFCEQRRKYLLAYPGIKR